MKYLTAVRASLAMVVCLFVCSLAVTAGSQNQVQPTAPTPAPLSPGPAGPQADAFVGDDTCTACHEAEGKSLKQTLHGKSVDSRTPAARPNGACETCHGPGR